jgi:uncharacterized protein YdaU (DUF1376 family)
MSKDPAFLFYPNDYLGGTMGFSVDQHGLYILALIFQFNNGRFTEIQINGILNNRFNEIKHKFKTDGNLYWNNRLDTEKEKRQLYVKSRRESIDKRWHKNDKPLSGNKLDTIHTYQPNPIRMGNENEDENEDENRDEVKVKNIFEIAFDSFVEMRTKIRKPLTENGKTLIIKKLTNMSPDISTQIKILEQSTMNSWQGIFQLKDNNQQSQKQFGRQDVSTQELLEQMERLKRT